MEFATIVQKKARVIFVLLQDHGLAFIGALSESHGSQRLDARCRAGKILHNTGGDLPPVDIVTNAEPWGLKVLWVHGMDRSHKACAEMVACEGSVMIHIETDPYGPSPPGPS